jgi:hypothetical protein
MTDGAGRSPSEVLICFVCLFSIEFVWFLIIIIGIRVVVVIVLVVFVARDSMRHIVSATR